MIKGMCDMMGMLKNLISVAACVAVSFGFSATASAKTVYIQCAWESGLAQPSSQAIEFYNGSLNVGTVTVYKVNGWKGSGTISSAYDRVEPVPPDGAEATIKPRDYGCKEFGSFTSGPNAEHVHIRPDNWEKKWDDCPNEAELEGWDGWVRKDAASPTTRIYYKPVSDNDVVYDVTNKPLGTILFTAPPNVVTYDRGGHGIILSVTNPDSGAIITYSSSSSGPFTEKKPAYTNASATPYTTYFHIEAPHYSPTNGSATVTINKSPIRYTLTKSYSVSSNETGYALPITVTTPSDSRDYKVEYSESPDGPFSSQNPVHKTIGSHTTYFQITAYDSANYITPAIDSATVTINAKKDMKCSISGGDTYPFDKDAPQHVTVTVEEPSSPYKYKIHYSTNNVNWTTNQPPPSFSAVGSHPTYIWVESTTDEYNDWHSSATITITEGTLSFGEITNPSYTNYPYSGHQPWYDTKYYTVQYEPLCSNCCWGVGTWWVYFTGRNGYTGTVARTFSVSPLAVTISSAGDSKWYDGNALSNGSVGVTAGTFADSEGLDYSNSYAFGSQTDVGWSYNDFIYTLKSNTDPKNYEINLITNKLVVRAVTPQSLKYPERLDIVGPDRLDVGIAKNYSAYVTYSDGTSNTVSSTTWSLFPGEPKARFTSGMPAASETVLALPKGAGNELVIRATNTMMCGTGFVTNGLVAWYPFDDNTVDDKSIYNKTGAKTDLVTRVPDRSTDSERAYRFSGGADSTVSVAYGTSSPLDAVTGALTVSAWICPETDAEQGILYRGGQLNLSIKNGTWTFSGTPYSTSTGLELNKWQLIVLTWDGSNVCTYVNGAKTGEFSRIGNLTPATTSQLIIGRSASAYFTGSMDDVRIYNRALSATDIEVILRGADVTGAMVQKTVTATKTVTVNPTTSIPVALDVETPTGARTGNTPVRLTFTTNSTAGAGQVWYGQYETVYGPYNENDYDAAQSGRMYGAGTNSMQTTVSGAGRVSFWWKTDCEKTYDYFVFKVDNKEKGRWSGQNDWTEHTSELPSGSHTLCWEYVKDGQNSVGKDAAWVDRLVWTPLVKPQKRTDLEHPVLATDGTLDTCVEVTWAEPTSSYPITAYRVSRKKTGESDAKYKVLTDTLTVREYRDYSAVPGVEYTYKVAARNAADWGDCGADPGYRGVVLSIAPDSCHFSNDAVGERFFVTVTSNTVWKAEPAATWIHVTPTNGGFWVTADATVVQSKRNGSVIVTCGPEAIGTTLHQYSLTKDFNVDQSARFDVAFVKPYDDWRTELQITTNGLAVADAYSPVSVFPATEGMKISFGWKNNGNEKVELPPVRFKVFDPTNPVPKVNWMDDGTGVGFGRILDSHSKTNCAFWAGKQLGTLSPGDYMLEAELDPNDTLRDPNRDNNKALFRFAIRNPALEIGKSVFAGDSWSNLEATVGSDFAQAPHVAMRQLSYTNEVGAQMQSFANAVQFGPYVPMNGQNGREITARKGVDIVFLVDFSSSMDQCIDGLVNNIGDFIERLLFGDPTHGIPPISDLRIKIAGFSDYRSDCSYKNWFEEGQFTTDRSLLRAKLEELRNQCYGGGGNGGESAYDALYYICKGWRTTWDPVERVQPTAYAEYNPADEEANGHLNTFRGTNVAARAVILFTDEPPHVPMDAPGCPKGSVGHELDGLKDALREADINLTIIGDGYYYGAEYETYATNIHWLADLVEASPKASNGTNRWMLVETGGEGTIANFTQDTSQLQDLAETIYLQMPEEAVIVEPTFTAIACGEGTLTFRWCNDSTADTNNTFTFTSEAGTMTRRADAPGASWDEVSFEFVDGTHPFRWSYRKIDYDGAVSDCGLIADVSWKLKDTDLEVTPPRTAVDWLGTNKTQIVTNDAKFVEGEVIYITNKVHGAIFDVKCNSIWKAVDYPDWIVPVMGGGEGNGRLIVNVAENPLFGDRLGAITVVAGEYGLPDDKIKRKTVFIEQSGRPLDEDGFVRIHTIDIKPRWPWSRKVDIDFLVQTPEKEGTPVRVKVWGLNKEGGSMITNYPTAALLRECAASNNVWVGFGDDATKLVKGDSLDCGGIDSDNMAYIVCPTSGLYRFTWDMASDWAYASAWACKKTKLDDNYSPWQDGNNGTFHTPEFSVRLEARPENPNCSSNKFHVLEADRTVRVDMRLGEEGQAPSTGRAGGSVLVGVERIGHPYGWVDPVLVDTTDRSLFPSNGWNKLDFVKDLPDNYTNSYIACVVNDDNVAIEGGMITNDVHWTADKIHVVRDNVFVTEGAQLTIDAEAIVKVCVDTRIYVLEAPGATSLHNILFEGAYLPRAFDARYGGDTLYFGDTISGTGTEGSTAGRAIVYSPVQSGKTYETEEVNGVGAKKCPHKAVYRVELRETYLNTNGVPKETSNWGFKYYSRGQRYGEIAMRPSEPGCAFYGWYDRAPNQTQPPVLGANLCAVSNDVEKSIGYVASKQYFVKSEECPFPLNGTDDSDKIIYALVCPTNWGDGVEGVVPIVEDASHAVVSLQTNDVITQVGGVYESVYYGKLFMPNIATIKLPDRLALPKACYETSYGEYGEYGSGGFVTAGVYKVFAHFTSAYSGSPYATFEVKPRPVAGSTVVFTPPKELYRPRRYDGVDKPSIEVLVPGMGDDGEAAPIPPTDFVTNWVDDVNWPNPGTYHVEISFNANYSGVLTNSYVIEKNPYYDFSSPRTSVGTGTEAADKAKTEVSRETGKPKRILYFGGENPEDAETAYVKSIITDDVDFNEWIIDNFVVWTNNVNEAGSPFNKYTEGMAIMAYPLICVLNPDDLDNPVFRTCGYVEKDELWAQLRTALSGMVAASLATVKFKTDCDTLTYSGGALCPASSDVTVTYAGTTLTDSQYDMIPETSSVDVGTYRVVARMKSDVSIGSYVITGETASVEYKIAPCAVSDSAPAAILARLGVGLNPPGETYNGEVHHPAVTSVVPYVSFDYGTDDWCNIGTHTLTVTFNGNYKGTISKTFEIAAKDVSGSAVIELDHYTEEIVDGKVPAASLYPNVLKVKDRVSNHVYVEGADYTLSFEGNFKAVGTNQVVATFRGNYNGVVSTDFVIEGTAAVIEALENLPPDATPEQVLAELAKFGWADARIYCVTNSTSEYNGFKAWTDAVGLDTAKGASHAYVSYRISELLDAATNLASIAGVEFKILDLSLDETLADKPCVALTITLKDGESALAFTERANDAKAAFAKLVRRASTLGGLAAGTVDASEVAVEDVGSDRTKVRIKVLPPSGNAGFVKIVLE